MKAGRKAGCGGHCKHIAAVWYCLWGSQKRLVKDVPSDKAPAELPAYWRASTGLRAAKACDDIAIVKHKTMPHSTIDPRLGKRKRHV